MVTLFVSPWNSLDPTNLPKLSILSFFAIIVFALGIANVEFLEDKRNRFFLIILVLFISQLVLVLIFGESDFSFKFYGTSGRNTGFLAYFSLTCILFACARAATSELIKKFIVTLLGLGGFLAIYGLLQYLNLEVWDYVNSYDSKVIGTFGNPNFQSAFMGIVSSAASTLVLMSKLSLMRKFGVFLIILLALMNVRLSSDQGYLSFTAGLSGAFLVYLFSKRHLFIAWGFAIFSGVGVLLLAIGFLNSGPLSSVIYGPSLQARVFYWGAAIKMIADFPFFGVGFDGFGDWYRRNRSQSAVEFNEGLIADSAHSIPLDIGASGGLILLILYFILIGLAVISIIQVVKRSRDFDVAFASIVAAWTAYQAQSLISINQLGIGIWGWSLTGLLIGYQLNTSEKKHKDSNKTDKEKSRTRKQRPGRSVFIAVLACAIGLVISLPPYLAANQYYKALQSRNAILIQKAAYAKPYDKSRFLYSAQILKENNLNKMAIEILLSASEIYPDSYELWQMWSQIPSATPEEVEIAKIEMERLQPQQSRL